MSSLVVHFEIHASEPQRLIDFYGGLFGWRFEAFEGTDYWLIATGAGSVQPDTAGWGINGGLTRREGPAPDGDSPVTGAVPVIGTDRVDELWAAALELGGSVQVPLADVAGVGRLGYLRDPDGNRFGLISPDMGDGSRAATEPAAEDLHAPMHGETQALDPMSITAEP